MVDGVVVQATDDPRSLRLTVAEYDGTFVGFVTGWVAFQAELTSRVGGSWTLTAPTGSGIELITPSRRLVVSRLTVAGLMTYDELAATVETYADAATEYSTYGSLGWRAPTSTTLLQGPAARIERTRNGGVDMVTVSGVTDLALLADRVLVAAPDEDTEFGTEWTVFSGNAEMAIQAAVCEQAGMGTFPTRQIFDSRLGTQAADPPQETSADWTITVTGTGAGVTRTWSGDTLTTVTTAATGGTYLEIESVGRVENPANHYLTAILHFRIDNHTLLVDDFGGVELQAQRWTAATGGLLTGGLLMETLNFDLIDDPVPAWYDGNDLFFAKVIPGTSTSSMWWNFTWYVNVSTAAATTATIELKTGGGVFTYDPPTTAGYSTATAGGKLSTLVDSLAETAGLALDTDWSADVGRPKVVWRQPVDRSTSVILSEDLNTVEATRSTVAMPSANYIANGTSGVSESTASQLLWRRRIESDSVVTNAVSADVRIADAAAERGYNVELADVDGLRWPDDYQIGDTVTVVIDGEDTAQVVDGIEINADADGVRVKPLLAARLLATDEPSIYEQLRDLRQRVRDLENP